jgi:hypothetical protein
MFKLTDAFPVFTSRFVFCRSKINDETARWSLRISVKTVSHKTNGHVSKLFNKAIFQKNDVLLSTIVRGQLLDYVVIIIIHVQ